MYKNHPHTRFKTTTRRINDLRTAHPWLTQADAMKVLVDQWSRINLPDKIHRPVKTGLALDRELRKVCQYPEERLKGYLSTI